MVNELVGVSSSCSRQDTNERLDERIFTPYRLRFYISAAVTQLWIVRSAREVMIGEETLLTEYYCLCEMVLSVNTSDNFLPAEASQTVVHKKRF